MSPKSILSALVGILLMSSVASAQSLVCALKVQSQGVTKCEAGIISSINGGTAFGGIGATMAIQATKKLNVFSTVAVTDSEHLEQHIRIEENGSHDLTSSSSLFTSIGSFTVLEAKGVDARLRCMPFTGSEAEAKVLICQ